MTQSHPRTRHPSVARVSPIAGARGLILVSLLLCAGASPLRAQSRSGEDEIDRRLNQAQEAYDNLELERAEQILHEAIELAESMRLEEPIVAEAYMMLGIVDFALGAPNQQVVDSFEAGLLIDRTAELDPYYATPDLDDLVAEARRRLPPEPEPPVPADAMRHNPVVTVRAGEPVELWAEVEPLAGVGRVVLLTRPLGETRYLLQDMELSRTGLYRGVIPAEDTQSGLQLEYYIEAFGRDGSILDSSGSAASPHVVIILGESDGRRPTDRRIMSSTIGFGTGGGLATGDPVVMGGEVDLNPGMAITPLHVYVDAEFRLGQHIELGPFLRLQLVLLEQSVEVEPLVGAKLKWYFHDGDNPLMYASFGGGYGNVRHTVDLNPTIDFVDTTREGPFHVGVGFGIAYLFTDHVGFLTDVYTMVMFDQVSVQLDLNAGLFLTF